MRFDSVALSAARLDGLRDTQSKLTVAMLGNGFERRELVAGLAYAIDLIDELAARVKDRPSATLAAFDRVLRVRRAIFSVAWTALRRRRAVRSTFGGTITLEARDAW